ncbi:dihydrofolate reductase [Actinomadura sp. GC306]|uniref:dihydrofolate reductase family protein n=1 Tax=Actinomadura sp. GC306 TaxID=2530367 RepID=UPI001042861D|nr:dihydrofolate reductase family protein [Actinomadura sp. GC306]TDC62727.1 dihydrofolate reductase [Actinomadura sp. GC306]
MRRIKLQVQISLDGYMGGPDGEMGWMTLPWSGDLEDHVDALSDSVDTIMLGRRLATGFIPAWESRPEGEDEASIDWMIDTPKVVVSNSLTESPWKNATVVGGDLTEIVAELKARPGGDVIVYGGSTLVTTLIARELIDELHLFVNPASLGAGQPVFPGMDHHQRFRTVAARVFDCGITGLHLEPNRS